MQVTKCFTSTSTQKEIENIQEYIQTNTESIQQPVTIQSIPLKLSNVIGRTL